jgi:DNA-binding MarR family transcriptional regulator
MVNVKYQGGIWRTMIDLLHTQKFWIDRIADDFGLTSQMAHALHEIPATGSLTMKALAGELWCDASNVTGIVDRLEVRGLVERRPAEHDRRVKCVVLTAAGKRLRKKIDDRFNESPPAIAALSEDDRRLLRDILERALDNAAKQRDVSSAD